jgi:Fe-S-cluster containining protein
MLTEKVKAVKIIYKELESEVVVFKGKSKISCMKGCSKCCMNNSIEATVLEFLPAAYELYRTGRSEEVVEKLDTNVEDRRCIFYNPFNENGGCTMYKHRGLICRLFGFSLRADKNGNPQLIACQLIKNTADKELLAKNIATAPFTTDYYFKLYGIDPDLAIRHYPINRAIRKAVELVMLYYNFKKPRKAS